MKRLQGEVRYEFHEAATELQGETFPTLRFSIIDVK